MELNFNKVAKHYLTVTLLEPDNRKFMVGTPNKNLLDKIMAMDTKIKTENIDENNLSNFDSDELYNICGEIMSVNKTKTLITGKELGELWDVEDLFLFFNTYMTFLDSIANAKN